MDIPEHRMGRIYAERMRICKGDKKYLPCPHYQKLLSRCQICGCFLKLKARISSEKCPKGKW